MEAAMGIIKISVKNDTARGLKTLRRLIEGSELDDRTAVEETTKRLSE